MTSELFNDGAFSSLSQGFGIIGQDRGSDYQVIPKHHNQQQFDALTEINNFAANIIELLPTAMGQKAAVFECDDQSVQSYIQEKINDVTPHFVRASKLARLCGGAGIFLGNSDSELDKPLSSAIAFYNVFEGGKNGVLQIDKIETDPLNPNFEKPKHYKLKGKTQLIHSTRIIAFYGIKMLTKDQQQRYGSWGGSVLQRSFDKIKNLDIADQSIANTISQFSRLIYEIDDLPSLLASDQGKQLLKDRLELLNYSWNVLKTLLINKGEKVYNLKIDYTGLDAMLNHFKEMLAGSADIPYQKLFNSGGGGGLGGSSSASGSIDRTTERQWADLVADKQKEDWLTALTMLCDRWLRQPVKYTLEFPNLLQLSESEETGIDKTRAETEKLKAETAMIQNPQPVDTLL